MRRLSFRRLALFAVALLSLVIGVALAAVGASADGTGLTLVCEATGDPTIPYVPILATASELPSLESRQGTIVPASGSSCPSQVSSDAGSSGVINTLTTPAPTTTMRSSPASTRTTSTVTLTTQGPVRGPVAVTTPTVTVGVASQTTAQQRGSTQVPISVHPVQTSGSAGDPRTGVTSPVHARTSPVQDTTSHGTHSSTTASQAASAPAGTDVAAAAAGSTIPVTPAAGAASTQPAVTASAAPRRRLRAQPQARRRSPARVPTAATGSAPERFSSRSVHRPPAGISLTNTGTVTQLVRGWAPKRAAQALPSHRGISAERLIGCALLCLGGLILALLPFQYSLERRRRVLTSPA